jgi:hypothetical protein
MLAVEGADSDWVRDLTLQSPTLGNELTILPEL